MAPSFHADLHAGTRTYTAPGYVCPCCLSLTRWLCCRPGNLLVLEDGRVGFIDCTYPSHTQQHSMARRGF